MPALKTIPVVAVFADLGTAEGAIDELWHAGFRHNQIGMASPGEGFHEATTRTGPAEARAANGAVAGAVAGGGIGAIVGTAAVALIPGLGPILAGGILTGLAVGTAAGAALGTYLGPFVALGIPKDQASQYSEDLKAGRTVVVVQGLDRDAEAANILRGHGPMSLRLP